MKAPRLALHLATAAWVAAAGPVHADVSHAITGSTRSMALHADALSSTATRRAGLAPSGGHESIATGAPTIDHVKSDRGALHMNRTFAGALRPTGGYGRTGASDGSGGTLGAATWLGVLDQELAQLRDGIERVRPMPQLLLGNRAHL